MFLHKQFTKFKLIIVGVCLLLTAVLTIQTSTATPSIGSNTAEFATTTLPLGGSTDSHMVRTADFDGDGLDDLFFARNGANQVILNGSGSQSFGTANTLGVALGDIDGDGDIDAVTANETVADRVWLNNGAGVFTDSGQSLTGAITSTAVDLADLDKDGDLDAVFIGDGFVTILTNNGTGTFTTTAFFFADDGRDVRLGDVDNDGDIDAVFAYNTTIPYGSIMLNNGTGTLAPPPAGTLDTSYAAGIVLGDVDADGDLDAFVSTSSGRPNVIMLNDGTGQFTAGQTLNTTGTAEAAFGDVDNDGDLDFYLANEGSTPNDIWLNDGTGTFASNGQAFGNDNTRSVVLFDLDTDGDLDVATANLGTADYIRANNLPHRNVLFQNNGTPIGSATTVTYDVRVGDLDGDGDEDVIAVKPGSSWSWLNDGTGAFTSGNQLFNGLAAQSADLGDLDGDGDLDLFIAVSGGGDAVWFNDGNGVFTDSGQTLGSNSANIEAVRLGDLDQDGDLDAIVGRGTGNSGIWLNNGNGVFVAGSPVPVTSVRDVAVGDVDADGDLDLFFARYSFSNVLWLNDGTGTFADSGQLIGGANQSQAVDFGDVDNDGDLDVLVGNDDGINAPSKLYLNDGAGILTDSGFNFGVGNQAREALLRDLDNDGDLDVYLGNSTGASSVDQMYLQTSSGTFAPAENLPNNGNTFAAGTADFDHDGDLDIFTGQSTTNGVGNRFLRNTGGTATIGVANTYPTAGYIPDGTEDDVLRTVFRHNGQSGDVALELAEMRLSLYDANCTTPLNTAQANAIIDTVLVRLDDGDLVFETDGSDVVVASVGMMSLTAVGEQTILFADGDPNVQVSVGGEKRYWVSLVAAVGAGAQNPRTACVRYDADAQTLVEGKTPDFGVSIADTSAVQTNNVPLAVTLSEVGVIGVLHGEFSRVLLATAVLLFVSGGLLFIQWHQRA